jgi:hypothetical protein
MPPKEMFIAKVQHVTAGLALLAPNEIKSTDVSAPAETENWLLFGFPTYSPTPKPAVLLVTCTLVAASFGVLSASPLITPVTPSKLKLKLSALAETGARHVTATAANDVSAKSFDFMSRSPPWRQTTAAATSVYLKSPLVNLSRVVFFWTTGGYGPKKRRCDLRVNEYTAQSRVRGTMPI